MPRKYPSTTVDEIGMPDSIPVKDVTKFVESSLASKEYRNIKIPLWDSVGDSLEDFYLSAKLEHNAMMQQKEILVEQQRLQRLRTKNQVRRIYQSQAKLRNRFIAVNVFLRDFADKRKSASKRGFAELELQKELEAAADKTRENLQILAEFRNTIKAECDEYEPYERVLDEVIQQSTAFPSVKELMDRCDSLMLAQVEISEMGEDKVMELEGMRKRLVKVANEAALQVLGLKNDLSNLDRLYEAARNEALKWEKTFSKVGETCVAGDFQKERIHDGINQLYRLLCQRRSLYADLPFEDVEGRMDFIQDEVELLRAVLDEYNAETHNESEEPTKLEIMC